jgi:hypothetical protein
VSEELFVVSESCSVGCGVPVVLLSSRGSADIFAYCDACGCTWEDPADAHLERGVNEITGIAERASGGVEHPALEQVARAGLEVATLRTLSESDWGTTLTELNAEIEARVAANEPGSG